MSDGPQTKLHIYRINEVLALKQLIETDVQMLSLLGAVLDPEDFAVMSRRLHELMPPGITKQVLLDSLIHLTGEVVTKELLAREAWRLAGNVPTLRLGRSVRPWRRQERDEWVPMQIVDHVPDKNRRGDIGSTISFRVLAGTSCSMILERFWTYRLCKFLSSKLGFSKPWGKYPFKKTSELTSLRLYGLIEQERSLSVPFFEQVTVPKSVEKYNRVLLRYRARDGFICPKRFDHPCHMCPVGYDQCPCAVHPRTFVKSTCEVCGKTGWIDPIHLALGLCVDCFVKKQLTRKD